MNLDQRGYALYLVMVVVSLLLAILTVTLTTWLVQGEILKEREEILRANNLILSAFSLWRAEMWLSGAETGETITYYLEDGFVTLKVVAEDDEEAVIELNAVVYEGQTHRTVRVTISPHNGEIKRWENLYIVELATFPRS